LAKPSKQTQAKRARELKRKEKRENKKEKAAQRKIEKLESSHTQGDGPPIAPPTDLSSEHI
jgi:hypothetical protein